MNASIQRLDFLYGKDAFTPLRHDLGNGVMLNQLKKGSHSVVKRRNLCPEEDQ